MIILAISDLHIDVDSDMSDIIKKTAEIVDSFNTHNKFKECVILTLGDIINTGHVDAYNNAKLVYDYLQNHIPNCRFLFAPGNHDLQIIKDNGGNFMRFDDFINSYVDNGKHEFYQKQAYCVPFNNNAIVLFNSIDESDRYKVKVNYASLYSACCNYSDYNKVLATHYSMTSRADGSDRHITSQEEMMQFSDDAKAQVFIHGHEHNRKMNKNYEMFNMQMVGIGPAFKIIGADYPQYNILSINESSGALESNSLFVNRGKEYILENKEFDVVEYASKPYEKPDNFIKRKISMFSKKDARIDVDLIELLETDNKIVLLAEAGMGKSYELQRAASILSEKLNNKVVFLYEAREYEGQKIEDLIPEDYKKYYVEDIVFIFDGYDEIQNQYANTFSRMINSFSKEHKSSKVIISTRKNFYQNNSQYFPGTFEGFTECSVLPFSDKDIENYCSKMEVNADFAQEAKNKDIYDLLNNPFYLSCIVAFFKENSYLPSKDDLMELLVDFILCNDEYKYKYKNDIQQKERLEILVEKLAFIMQSKLLIEINIKGLYEWFNKDDVELLFCSGLLTKSQKKIRFVHNNFREYLAARFVSSYDFEKILDIITVADISIIKPSWLNVVSYLTKHEIFQHNLMEWISKNQPEKVCLFEVDKLPDATRKESYATILTEAINSGVWIFHYISSIEKFSNFDNSRDELLKLISTINNSKDFWEVANSVVVVSYKDKLYDLLDKVKDALVRKICTADEAVIQIEGLDSLERMNLLDKDTLSYIVTNAVNNSERFSSHLVYYLIEKECVLDNFSYILQCIAKRNTPWYEIGFSFDLSFLEISKSLTDATALADSFMIFTQHKVSIYKHEEIIDNLINNAVSSYLSNPDSQLFDGIYDYAIELLHRYERKFIDKVTAFFEKTNTISEVYNRVISCDLKKAEMYFLFRNMLDDLCMNDLADKYVKDSSNKYDYFELIVRDMEDGDKRDNYINIIKEKTGQDLKDFAFQDYESVRIVQTQKYFNALFDKNEYLKLVNEFLSYVDSSTICKTISDYNFRQFDEGKNPRFDLEKIKWDIYHYLGDEDLVVDFSKIKFSMDFFMDKIKEILYEDRNRNNIKLSSEQKSIIESFCTDIISHISNDEIKYKPKGFTLSNRVNLLAELSSLFQFVYDDQYIDLLIKIPGHCFGGNGENLSEYITNNYNEELIDKAVMLLNKDETQGSLAMMFISYCQAKNDGTAINIAKKIIIDSEYLHYDRSKALEYILKFSHIDNVVSEYSQYFSNDEELMLIFDEVVPNSQIVTDALVSFSQSSDDTLKYLPRLLKRNSKYGLEMYISLCKSNNRIPDDFSNNRIPNITESIRNIYDVSLLDLLVELLCIRYEEGFIDADAFGLSGSLNAAFQNVAKNNYTEVKKALSKVADENPDNKELNTFCKYFTMNKDREIGVEYESPINNDLLKEMLSSK